MTRAIVAGVAWLLLCSAAAAGMPALNIWTGARNPDGRSAYPECEAFWRDYNDPSTGLRAALRERFDCFYSVADVHPIEARLRGITRLPTFITPSGRIVGYTTPEDLLARLGLRPPIPEAPGRSEPASDPGPVASAPAVSDELQARLSELNSALRKHAEELKQLKAQQLQPTADPKLEAKLKWLHDQTQIVLAEIGQLKEMSAEIKKLPRDWAQNVPDQHPGNQSAPEAPASSTGTDIPWGTIATWSLTALGVGGPIAGGVGAGISVAGWLLRRRRARHAAAEIAVPSAVPVDEPAPSLSPAPIVAHVLDDVHAEAFNWASSHLMTRYPNSEGYAAAMRSLMQQYLDSKGANRG